MDLGVATAINQVVLTPHIDGANAGYGFPVNFVIEVSSNNFTWTTMVSRSNYARPAGTPQAFSFSSSTARYVRITGSSLRTNPNDGNTYRMRFVEVQVISPQTNQVELDSLPASHASTCSRRKRSVRPFWPRRTANNSSRSTIL